MCSNIKKWCLSVTRRYYCRELDRKTIAYLREIEFPFYKYKEEAFSNCSKSK